jgi:membrane peptidoglycan carboxypeptidase
MAAARAPLTQVVAAGTATRARIDRPQGGKTGTHQNFNEAWFVGFVPQFSTAVWVGYPDFQAPLRNVMINDQLFGRVYGGTVPAPIWAEFMTYLLRDVPVGGFPEDPPGVEQYYATPSTEVPLVVGLIQKEAVNDLYDAHLRPNVVEVSSIEEQGVVLTQDLEEGSEAAHGQVVTIEVSSGIPPEAPLVNLLNLTIDEAVTETVTDRNLVGRIVQTSPGAGAPVTHGQSVVMIVGKFIADD